MSESKARRIIEDLLSDSNLYKEMSERENRIWGKTLTDPRRMEAIREDQEAARLLRLNRDRMALVPVLRKHGIAPESGLSLACGNGRAERTMLARGICKSFHGIDISAEALEMAREQAAKAGLDISYEKADLNYVELKAATYDLVLTQNCLHHVLRLEHLAEQIHKALRPGGVLWIQDYVGETQFQYSDERLDLVNKILALLPEQYRYSTVNRRMTERIERREPGRLASPFEAIRSAEIIPVFKRYFNIVESVEYGSILRLVCAVGTRCAFAKNEDSRALFELLFFLDRYFVDKGLIQPSGGVYLMTPKHDMSGSPG